MGLSRAALLLGLALLGAGSPPQEWRLGSARIEGVLEPEGSGARVTVSYVLSDDGIRGEAGSAGAKVSLLAIASPAELTGVEVLGSEGWSALDLVESAPGRMEGRWASGDAGGELTLRYRAPLAQVRSGDGTVTGVRIPVLAPLTMGTGDVAGGAGASGPVEISLRSQAPLAPGRPFPSGLRFAEDRRGWELAGSAPAVPGVIRFGEHHPEAAGTPREFPGGMFWGLWFALGALLAGYVAWVRRVEARAPELRHHQEQSGSREGPSR